MSTPPREVYHLDPGLPCLVLLNCRKKWVLTAREIRTRFSLRLSHDSDFSNFVRAERERRGIDVIGALQGQSWQIGQKGRENGSRCYRANGEVIPALETEKKEPEGEAPATHL